MPVAPNSPATAGFTLIELMIALVLFALISLAGINLVEAMIRLQRGSEGRSERLAEVQRAMFLVSADFGQLVDGPQLAAADLSLVRMSSDGEHRIVYRQDAAGLHRQFDGQDRLLLPGISALGWRFAKHGNWTGLPISREDASRPQAVEITFQLQPRQGTLSGPLRRVFELPAAP